MYLTIEEVKKYNIESINALSDEELTAKITLYSEIVDEYCNTKFSPVRHTEKLNASSKLRLSKTPILSVESVKYLNEIELKEDIDYYIYLQKNVIEIDDIFLNDIERRKNALTIQYEYGYKEVPAIVKAVILDLLKLDISTKDIDENLKGENWDGEYSYTRSSKETESRKKDILSLLDNLIEHEYVSQNTGDVRIRII